MIETPGLAVDLGSGDGTETRELLRRGWNVVAVDKTPGAIDRLQSTVVGEERARLTGITSPFADVELPASDLIYAGLSLPFCEPDVFPELWSKINAAVRAGGRFAGHFFGPRDSWAGEPDMTFLSKAEARALFTEFQLDLFHEQDEDGEAVSGPKHWHAFHVIARKG